MNSRDAVIVAHGSPGDPHPQDAAMTALAGRVSALLPGWTVRGATLASPESLGQTLQGTVNPLIYPFFMAEGYFTGEVLPRRLRDISATYQQLPAFGSDPAIPDLVAEAAITGARDANVFPEKATLLLAAHGSLVSPASRLSTLTLAQDLRLSLAFRAVVTGFIEEPPFLADAAQGLGYAICLPLFTLHAGHVLHDVPEAMTQAGFEGPILPPIGDHFSVPRLIAAALERFALKAAA